MRKRTALVACVAGALSSLLWTGEARADLTGFSWDHATLNGGPRFGTDNLNLGLGLNVGYTLDMGLYLGGLFNYFFGETIDTPGGEAGFDVWFLMFDIGYDIGIGDKFVVRPTGSIGMDTVHSRVCSDLDDECESNSESDVVGAIGANAIVLLGNLTLGGETRFLFADNDADGVWFGFNIGTVF
jgi:hypothetical protein